MIRKLCVILVLFSTQVFANVCIDLKLPANKIYKFKGDIEVESFDGTMIAANLITPKNINGKLPTIIFVNSWTLEEHQYIKQAIKFVKKGYQVFSYSTRGWGCSGGYIDVIGPKDVKDLRKVVDWIYDNTEIDKTKLGIAGISYGGGMTLMGLAQEPRITTGFAMSTWANLYEAMYHQESPRLFWSSILMATGFVLGRVDSVLRQQYRDLILSNDKTEIQNWAYKRSPIKYIDQINKRNVPVYISNNLGDNLFQPNNVIRYFKKLKTPKILDLNQGTHATGELTGLFTVSNYTFKKLHEWFDYWLKDKRINTSLKFGKINFQTDLNHDRDSVSEADAEDSETKDFYLHPRKIVTGKLKNKKFSDEFVTNRIRSGLDTFATTGIPLISALVDGHFKLPVYTYLPLIDPIHGIKFVTEKIEKGLKIRGIPKLKLNLDSHGKPYQVVAYLYDVNALGAGKLITHGVVSGSSINGAIDMEIVATAYDIPKGHKLALIMDTKDLLYAPKSLKPFKLDFKFDGKLYSQLKLPIK